MSGIARLQRGAGRCRRARPLRSRHHARHAAPHRPTPLRRRGVVREPRRRDGREAARRLGPEPFDPGFDAAYLHAALKRRRVGVKLALMAGASSSAPATSTPARRCSPPASTRARAAIASAGRAASGSRRPCAIAGSRASTRRIHLARLPRCARHGRRVPGAGPRVRPCGAGMWCLRNNDPPRRPGPAVDVFLPDLPETLNPSRPGRNDFVCRCFRGGRRRSLRYHRFRPQTMPPSSASPE